MITIIFDAFIVRFVSNVFFGANLTPLSASPMLRGLGPQCARDSAAVHGLACRYRFVCFLRGLHECMSLIKSGFAGTGIAAVQGLSGLTKGDSVFIQKQERITKAFLSSTVAVNGLCTRSYLSPSSSSSSSPRITLPTPRHFSHAL